VSTLEQGARLRAEEAEPRCHVVAIGERQVWPVGAEDDVVEGGDLGGRLDRDLVVGQAGVVDWRAR
jgi:hypothetical protein